MRPGRRALWGLLLLLLLWGAWLLRVATLELPVPRLPTAAGVPSTLRGALHVHTTASDGRADLEEVAAHAREAGLDFLVLGDHNVLPAPASRIQGVLVVPGVELSTPDGHILAYGGSESLAPSALRREDPLGAARASGSLVVLSHPVNQRRPWAGPFAGADGMEVLSADSAYRVALRDPLTLGAALLAYPASPDVAILHLLDGVDEARARFHQALAAGEVEQGFCGHDAHGLPAYQPIFRVLRTHLFADALPREPEPGAPEASPPPAPAARAAEVVAALRAGLFYCAVDGLADPGAFFFEVGPEGVRAGFDGELAEALELSLSLYRDGAEVASGRAGPARAGERGESLVVRAPASVGRWHVEVELERPWLLTRRRFLWILSGTREIPPPEPEPVAPTEPPADPAP